MDEGMIKVAELREGDVFEVFGGVFSAVRIWGGGDLRTVHLQTWAQGQGAELKLRSAMFVRLVSRVPDEDLKRVQDERTAASLASFDALVREIDQAPDAPDAPEAAAEPAGDDLEAALVEVLSADLAKVKAERDATRAEVDELRHELAQFQTADLKVEVARRERDQLRALLADAQRKRDEALATLARYTAVYADPDTPAPPPAADLSRCAPLPGMAEMADRILAGAVPDGVCVAKEIHDGTPLGLAIMRRQWKHLELADAPDDWEVPPSPDALALASMTRWQAELAAWQARELPCDDAGEQRWRLYAGVQEELGEVARCLLKGSQDIRGGAEVWRAQLPGEIGDVLVYLTQLATACGVDLGAAYAEARAKVLARRFATAEVAK